MKKIAILISMFALISSVQAATTGDAAGPVSGGGVVSPSALPSSPVTTADKQELAHSAKCQEMTEKVASENKEYDDRHNRSEGLSHHSHKGEANTQDDNHRPEARDESERKLACGEVGGEKTAEERDDSDHKTEHNNDSQHSEQNH